MDLFVTDGHEGLLSAVADLFPTTLRQRCLVHKQRTIMSAIPKREQQEVITELKMILFLKNWRVSITRKASHP